VKEKKALEGKLKDNKELLSSRTQDTLNQSKIVQDKDVIIVSINKISLMVIEKTQVGY
jgi:hypothetical protein